MVGCAQLDENGKNCSSRICFIFWKTLDLVRLSIDLVINWIKTSKTFEPFCTQSEMYVLCAHIHMYKTLYHRRVKVWARKKSQTQFFIVFYWFYMLKIFFTRFILRYLHLGLLLRSNAKLKYRTCNNTLGHNKYL